MVLVDIKPSRLKVHVSCCDADIGFANKLVSGLMRYGRFNVSVTPKQQAERTGWKDRIGELIAQADTVLFVLSSEAVASEAFLSEAELASDFSKRMLSLIASPLRIADVPEPLAGLKHRRFDQEPLFENKLELLASLLDADADWIRMHTGLFSKARKWKDAGFAEQHLLTGADIKAAKTWTFGRPYSAPKPTMLHVQFIQASEIVQAAGGSLSAGASLDKKRARRKAKPAEAPRPARYRRSRPVPASLPARQPSWTPAETEPVAVASGLAPASNETPAAFTTVSKPLPPRPALAPAIAVAIQEPPVAPASVPVAEKPVAAAGPAQLAAAAPEVARIIRPVINQDELDGLLASLVPDDEDELSQPAVEPLDDVEAGNVDDRTAEPVAVTPQSAPVEGEDYSAADPAPSQDEPAETASLSSESVPEESQDYCASAELPSDDDDVSGAPDPIDVLRARNIPGTQKDLDELDPHDLYQVDDVKSRKGQNRLVAAMASSLVIVAGVAIWQMLDYTHMRANADGQALAQVAEVSSEPVDRPAPHGTNLIERAMDKVECLLQTSTPPNGKCPPKIPSVN